MAENREQILLERKLFRQEYGTLFDEVSAILFKSDPISINFETHTDEYEPEVCTILPRERSETGFRGRRTAVERPFGGPK